MSGKVDVPCGLCGGCLEVMLPCPACQGAAASVGKAGALVELNSLIEWLDHDGYDIEAARIRKVRSAVAELIEADKEYDAAFYRWEVATAGDPADLSEEQWREIADRFEEATMRRIAALARVQP